MKNRIISSSSENSIAIYEPASILIEASKSNICLCLFSSLAQKSRNLSIYSCSLLDTFLVYPRIDRAFPFCLPLSMIAIEDARCTIMRQATSGRISLFDAGVSWQGRRYFDYSPENEISLSTVIPLSPPPLLRSPSSNYSNSIRTRPPGFANRLESSSPSFWLPWNRMIFV